MIIGITGTSGFLGSNLTRLLQKAGYEVIGLGGLEPGDDVPFHTSIPFLKRLPGLKNALKKTRPDVIIHTACCYEREGTLFSELIDANLIFGLALLNELIREKCRCYYINIGTALPAEVSNYASMKHLFCDSAKRLLRAPSLEIEFINIKLHHMYGLGESKESFVTKTVNSCLGPPVKLSFTDGSQRRDFINVNDVCTAVLTVVKNLHRVKGIGDIEVGSGSHIAIRELVEKIHYFTRSRSQLDFGSLTKRANEPPLMVANNSLIESLGWRQSVSLESGLKELVDYAREIEL